MTRPAIFGIEVYCQTLRTLTGFEVWLSPCGTLSERSIICTPGVGICFWGVGGGGGREFVLFFTLARFALFCGVSLSAKFVGSK